VTDTPAEREAESTWTRLRRRKVVQWGLVYVAAAWGFLQGLEYVTESFQLPHQAQRPLWVGLDAGQAGPADRYSAGGAVRKGGGR